jgi:hypothetical protein
VFFTVFLSSSRRVPIPLPPNLSLLLFIDTFPPHSMHSVTCLHPRMAFARVHCSNGLATCKLRALQVILCTNDSAILLINYCCARMVWVYLLVNNCLVLMVLYIPLAEHQSEVVFLYMLCCTQNGFLVYLYIIMHSTVADILLANYHTLTCYVTRHGIWIGNCIYWTLANRNYN